MQNKSIYNCRAQFKKSFIKTAQYLVEETSLKKRKKEKKQKEEKKKRNKKTNQKTPKNNPEKPNVLI